MWLEPSKVEKRNGHQEESKQGARVQKPQPPTGAQKRWTQVVRSGQLGLWDRYKGETGANVTNRD